MRYVTNELCSSTQSILKKLSVMNSGFSHGLLLHRKNVEELSPVVSDRIVQYCITP